MAKYSVWIAIFILMNLLIGTVNAGWFIDIESGLAFSGYNDVRIPGNSGTDISLSEDLKAGSSEYFRLRLTKDLGDRHKLIMLIAPLKFKSSGTLDRDVVFNSERFSGGLSLNSIYRFDSYRLAYRYTWFDNENFTAGIGFTAKIRDASIRLENENVNSEKKNTGFVPLLNFSFDWRFASRFGFIFEGDALAAPQGRAEDLLLAIYGNPSNRLRLRLGYRILEGGADNDEVYTFALVHYVSVGLSWEF